MLPVGFVRQNEVTCAPATLTMLAHYWGLPADHLAMAAEICYDGTAGWKQRDWIARQGWLVQDFTVTPAAARQLLDRGLPFALATTGAEMGHLQAVIGYDDRTECLIIRDPNLRHHLYFPEAEFFRSQAASGPRGTVFVPPAEAARLSGLALPDAPLHDQAWRLDQALDACRSTEAAEILAVMERMAPGHQLVISCRTRVQLSRGNHAAALASVNVQLQSYPEDLRLQVLQFRLSAGEMNRADRLSTAKQRAAGAKADPWWHVTLATMLAEDARSQREFDAQLRRMRRMMPQSAATMEMLMLAAERRRDWPQLLEVERFSACLSPRDDARAARWLQTALQMNRGEEVLTWLHRRWQKDGARDAGPALGLLHAVERLHGLAAAAAFMDQALKLRPEDGVLLLAAALAKRRAGDTAAADALLQAARGKASAETWHRQMALREAQAGRPAEAIVHWRAVLESMPLHLDAHHAVCSLLSEMEGHEAAARQMEAARAAHPMNFDLRQLHIGILRRSGDPRAIQVLEAALAADAEDAWCLRELALEFTSRGRLDDALRSAQEAVRISPRVPASWTILGNVQKARGEQTAAGGSFAHAVNIDPDWPGALQGLMSVCSDPAHRLAVLDWALQSIATSLTRGDAVPVWRGLAAESFSADDCLARLVWLRGASPALWEAHSAVVNQLSSCSRHAEAAAAGAELCRQFPAVSGSWITAAVAALRGAETQRAKDLAQQALQLEPSREDAHDIIFRALMTEGREEDALAGLRELWEADPLNHSALLRFAGAAWDDGDRFESFEIVQRAVLESPGFSEGWEWLLPRAAAAGRAGHFADRIAVLSARRPHDVTLLLYHAEALAASNDSRAADELMVRALSLRPSAPGIHLQRVRLLAAAKRFTDALHACRPAVFGAEVPESLMLEESRIHCATEKPAEAAKILQRLITRDPGNADAWELLTDCAAQQSLSLKQLEAAERWAALRPGSADALAALGRTHLQLAEDSSERAAHLAAAETNLARARSLAPHRADVLRQLAECLLQTGRQDEALRLISAAEKDLHPDVAAVFQIIFGFRIHPGTLNPDAAARVLASEVLDAGAIHSIHSAALPHEMSARLWVRQLEAAMNAGSFRTTATLMCWLQTRGTDYETIAGTLAASPLPDWLRIYAWEALSLAWVEGNYTQPVLDAMSRHPGKLRVGDKCWVRITDILMKTDRWGLCVVWTADWRERTSCDVFAVLDAGRCRSGEQGPAAAAPIYKHVIERAPADSAHDDLHALRADLALVAAAGGNVEQAVRYLEAIPAVPADSGWRRSRHVARRLAEGLIAAHRKDRTAASRAFQQLDQIEKWRTNSIAMRMLEYADQALNRIWPNSKLLDKFTRQTTGKGGTAPRTSGKFKLRAYAKPVIILGLGLAVAVIKKLQHRDAEERASLHHMQTPPPTRGLQTHGP